MMKRNSETRYKAQFVNDCDPSQGTYSNWNSLIGSSDMYSCIPDVSIGGDTTIARQGAQITPTRLRVDWNFAFTAGDAYARDMEVHLYLLTSKQVKGFSQNGGGQVTYSDGSPTTPQTPFFLDSGLGGPALFDATFVCTKFPVYKDRYTLLKHKVFRLSKPIGQVGYNSASSGLISVGGMKMEHSFSYTFKKLPVFKYDEQGTQPNNFAPFWCVGYRNLGSQAPDTTGGNLQVTCRPHLWWKDD